MKVYKLGNKTKKICIFSFIVFFIGIIIYILFNKYYTFNSYNNENVVAVFLDGTKSSSIPAKETGWAFKSVTCDNGTAEWDNSTWSLSVSSTTKTKCTLYFVQPTQTAVQYITAKVATDSSLIADGTTDNNLRYTGADPNNYVLFNNELWRIIGVMNNIENSSGQSKSLLKIIRNESLGEYSWDTCDSTINSGSGINQWGPSDGYEGADLMRELNTDYLGNTYVGIDGKWYNSRNNSKATDKPASTINQSSQSMIETVVWNLGSPSNNGGTYDSNWNSNLIPSTSYIREREDTNFKVCSTEGYYASYCNDTVTRTSTWTGKVGLILPSDYGYSTGGGNTTSRTTCLSTSMNSWTHSDYPDCTDNSWIYNIALYTFTLSSYGDLEEGSYRVFFIGYDGKLRHTNASFGIVHPVVFLKSSVYITGGTGTSTDPYTLG